MGGIRKRQSNPKSKFVYRHYMQLLAVCPPQMAKANMRSSIANKQTYECKRLIIHQGKGKIRPPQK